MNMKRTAIIVFSIIVIAIVIWGLLGKIKIVDNKPAIALADSYFDELQHSRIEEAYSSYSEEIKSQNGENWKKLLTGLDKQFGAVTSKSLTGMSVVPVAEVGCWLLSYNVNRTLYVSEDRMIVCPSNDKGLIASNIVGYEMRRADTGQTISVGLTLTESKISAP